MWERSNNFFFWMWEGGENISTCMIIALSTDNLHDTITDELSHLYLILNQ